MDLPRGVRQRGPIVVAGPLAPFADGLRGELAGLGYAGDTVADHVHLLADLSDWLGGQGLTAADLTSAVAEDFVRARRASGRRVGVSGRAVAPLLRYLRRRQVAPPPSAVVAVTAQDVLLVSYRDHLEGERGLSAGTVGHYLRCARVFLSWLAGPLEASLSGLSAGQVVDYVLGWAAGRRGRPVDLVRLPALRSLLRFLHAAGHVARPLAAAVPAGRGRPAQVVLPRAAYREHVRAVLAGCDRGSAAGRRDYAIMLMMARLALRGGEVGRLRLDEVNWRAGELTIRGKGGRADVLPLPADVGEAMANYLLHARPATTAPNLFVSLVAPFTGLAPSSITLVVARACARVGVPRFGPHGLRHASACDLLAAGASMEEIAQLLRHAQQRTTALYAKIDKVRLVGLALPCPRGAAR